MAEYIEAWLPGPSNTQFYTRTYPSKQTPPKAYLVFLHGFIEHIARHAHIHTALAARGITVFAYDLRGYGRTALDVEKRSEGSKYGRSSWDALLGDCEWAVKRVREEAGGGKVFLMGHSMGGELSLTFVTRPAAPPSKETVSFLAGVIATSPLIHQTHPAPKALRWVGGHVGKISPYMMIPANVKPQDLSHNKEVGKAYVEDPLVIDKGSLRAVGDMLDQGEQLLLTNYQYWPENLPVLIIHGTDDKVSSPKASSALFDKLKATDKKLSLYDGGYHELQNETDGVQEKLIEEVVGWIEVRLGERESAPVAAENQSALVIAESESAPVIAETATPPAKL